MASLKAMSSLKFLISLAVTLVVTALGAGALWHIVKGIEPAQLLASLNSLSALRLCAAAIFSLLCYIALSGYDVIALRSLGYETRWSRAMAASTSAYALSHNLGFAPLTASYARHHIYRNDGIRFPDVARIVVLCGTSFWLGVALVLGLSLLITPNLLSFYIEGADSSIQYPIALAILAVIVSYVGLIALGCRKIGVGKWHVPLPSVRDAVLQLLVSTAEMALAAGIIFVLLPSADPSLYPQVLAAYVVAFTAVLITHAPGGIGVLEAIIFLLVPQVPKPELLSALLLFRIIFHVGPLIAAIAILAMNRKGQPVVAAAAPA